MNFNVFKINFIDINDKDVEEIIHSDSKENAIIKLKEDYCVKKIIKTLQIPTISELKKNYGLS